MKTNDLNARLLSIKENECLINPDALNSLKNSGGNAAIEFFLAFKADIKNNLFIANGTISYVPPSDPHIKIATVSYSLIIEIRDIASFLQENKIDLPDGFIKTVICDIYSTGRVLAMKYLSETILKDQYLPLGGSSSLWDKFKEMPKIEIIK